MQLNNRTETVLKNLVEIYIKEGQPVGSKTIANLPSVSVSAATVRNIMSELEQLGLVIAPHTSAGRIPTAQGYRLFVDSMVKVSPLTKNKVQLLVNELSNAKDPDDLLAHASEIVSDLTKFAGVILLPNHLETCFHQIEFLALSKNRILVILVTQDGRVQNRIISVDKAYSDSELVEAANFFNQRYKGSSLSRVRQRLVKDMKNDNDQMHRLSNTALQAAQKVLEDEGDNEGDVMLSGEQNLLDVPDLCEIGTLQKLFDAFKTKQDLLSLLDRSLKSNGLSVFIGEESGYSALGECSIVASPYEIDGKTIGTLGVIGPTRMAYDEVISVVDITSKLLSQALRNL